MSLGADAEPRERETGDSDDESSVCRGSADERRGGDGRRAGVAGERYGTDGAAGSTDTDAAGGPAATPHIGANELLELLGNRRRRLLWRYLRTAADETALSDASRRIAAWEHDVTPAEVKYDQRKSVYTSLRQFHCPKMADAGLVEFDDREGTVRLTSDLPEELVIEIEPDTENVRQTALGALALSSGLILGAWAIGLPVFGPLSFGGALFAVAAAVAAAGLVYVLAARSEHGVPLGDALARVDG